MKACTFFGHRQCPESLRQPLKNALVDLIEAHNVDTFYVGNQGQFDQMVQGILLQLENVYPHVRYGIVLTGFCEARSDRAEHTMLPEGIEKIHPKYTIAWRNDWMIEQSEYVVCYVTHAWGGAAQYRKKAMIRGKWVVDLMG